MERKLIDECNITSKAVNCLKAEGFYYEDEMRYLYYEDRDKLMSIYGFGKKSLDSIAAYLGEDGKDDPSFVARKISRALKRIADFEDGYRKFKYLEKPVLGSGIDAMIKEYKELYQELNSVKVIVENSKKELKEMIAEFLD